MIEIMVGALFLLVVCPLVARAMYSSEDVKEYAAWRAEAKDPVPHATSDACPYPVCVAHRGDYLTGRYQADADYQTYGEAGKHLAEWEADCIRERENERVTQQQRQDHANVQRLIRDIDEWHAPEVVDGVWTWEEERNRDEQV